MPSFAAIQPGEILKTEFLDELGLTAYAFSKSICMNRSGVSDIINGERAITAETALRFARFFGNSPQFWLNLQDEYNLRVAERRVGRQIIRDVEHYAGIRDRPL
ncbi:MAG: HigA family addiction module antitoxin [Pseudomonadota bacterium]